MRFSLVAAAAAVMGSGVALADGFLNSGASARAAGMAGAFLSGSQSPLDAMALNPAGLAQLNGVRAEISLAAGLARGSFTNPANSNGRLNSNGVLPYGAFAAPIRKSRLTLGFAALPELMSAARWNYNDTPGGIGGVQYGMTDHRSEILAMRMAAGIGYHVSSALQLGVTVGAVYNSNTLQTAYTFQSHPALAGMKTQLDLNTSGVGWNTSVGALLRPSSRLELGATYKSRTSIASNGVATGNIGVQLAKLGLGGARPDFRYDARVDNILPQSLLVSVAVQANPRTRLVAQGDWVNWKNAFKVLPVTLTNGNNQDINGVLGSNGIEDAVPLAWKDQFVARVGIERKWLEKGTLRAGYAHTGNPVPSSTLSPLTAAITRHAISLGFGHQFTHSRLDFAYTVDPRAHASVGRSGLLSGEYSNSRVGVQIHMLRATYSWRM